MKHMITTHKPPTILPLLKPLQANGAFLNRVGSRVGPEPGEILLDFRWGYRARRCGGTAAVEKVQRRAGEKEEEERESGETQEEEEREDEEEDDGLD